VLTQQTEDGNRREQTHDYQQEPFPICSLCCVAQGGPRPSFLPDWPIDHPALRADHRRIVFAENVFVT
jgi:hypothetical protein